MEKWGDEAYVQNSSGKSSRYLVLYVRQLSLTVCKEGRENVRERYGWELQQLGDYSQSVESDVEEGTVHVQCLRYEVCLCRITLLSGSDSELVTVKSMTILSLLELSAIPYSRSLMPPCFASQLDCALDCSIKQVKMPINWVVSFSRLQACWSCLPTSAHICIFSFLHFLISYFLLFLLGQPSLQPRTSQLQCKYCLSAPVRPCCFGIGLDRGSSFWALWWTQ